MNNAIPSEILHSVLDDAARSLVHLSGEYHLEAGKRARLRATAALQNALVLTDPNLPDNPIVYANRAFLKLSGYPEEEIVGFNCRFLQGPKTDRAEVARLRDAIRQEQPIQVTLLNYRKDGTTFWNELTIAPVRDEKGILTHFVAVQTDVTMLKETQTALQESEKRLQLALASGGLGTWNLDLTTHQLQYLSAVWKSHFGFAPDAEVTKDHVFQAIHPDDCDRVWQTLQQAVATGRSYQAEYRAVWPDGSLHWINAYGTPTYTAAGEPQSMIGLTQEITVRKQQEADRADAQRQSRRAQLLLEAAGEGFFGLDMAGRNTFVNPAAANMLGFTVEELLGLPMHATHHHTYADGRPYPREECPIFAALEDGTIHRITGEVFWRKDGTSFPVDYISTPVYEEGRIVGAVVTFRDITERLALEAEQQRLLTEALERADRDPLTGLWNHRTFHSRLRDETVRAERECTPLAVVVLDLDNFQFFNDNYGHAVGDNVLRLVAQRLRQGCRPYDTVARFGGDEFAVLIPGVGYSTIAEVEARLRAEMKGLAYRPDETGTPLPITISLGAALYQHGSQDCHEMLQQADRRLLRSKTGGAAETEADQVRSYMGRSPGGFSMLDALVTAVDNKDRYTRKHSEDVMAYSLMIARELGLDTETQKTIGVAALLHDVGKIGVPDAVLRKPGNLTDEEFAAIKQHPTMGAVMVEAASGLDDILDAVRHHHERWDGDGYPSGRKEKETPLIARLMAVADAFSAMTTDRPYRKGMDRAKALAILTAGAGSQWDPACISAFLAAMGERLAPPL